jgi:hypothetical protein
MYIGAVKLGQLPLSCQKLNTNKQPAPVPEWMPQLLTAMGCWGRGYFALPPSCCAEGWLKVREGKQCLPAPNPMTSPEGQLCSTILDATDVTADSPDAG